MPYHNHNQNSMAGFKFFPTSCPACGSDLVIESGKADDVIKLMCKNDSCEGKSLKRLQKGIIELEIKGLGPKMIEKLFNAGIESAIDLFNPDKFNEHLLVHSGEFKCGRALEKIVESVKTVKEIPINKAILSLQLQVRKDNGDGFISIGKSLSEQIGKMLSGVKHDFSGLSIQVRDELNSKGWLYKTIVDSIHLFESNGINIIRYEEKKKSTIEVKRAVKKVDFIVESNIELTNQDIVEKLGWIKSNCPDCDFLVVDDKKAEHPKIELAKTSGVKVITYKDLKLLFL